jgi:hypothetical protein
MSKRPVLLLIAILTVSSLIMIENVFAQLIAKPAIPEFTIKFVESSYNLTTTDPYTGVKKTREIDNNTLEVVIKNQPFTPYAITDSDGANWNVNLYYNVRRKGHFEEDWNTRSGISTYPNPDLGDYTVISFPTPIYFTDTAQADFQVKALEGYIDKTYNPDAGLDVWRFNGEESEWSQTQTITLGENQTPTQQAEVIISAAIAVAAISAGLGLLVYFKKRKH